MTIKDLWVDSSKASFHQSFKRDKDWLSAAHEASIWLDKIFEKEFSGQTMFVFLSDSTHQADSKINRYRKFSKRPFVTDLIVDGCIVIEEKIYEDKYGLYFWSLLNANNISMPKIIDYLRIDRGSFLFIADKEVILDDYFSNIIKSRVHGSLERIDQSHVIQNLIKHKANPVRIWGEFDDPKLWVEIYSSYNFEDIFI